MKAIEVLNKITSIIDSNCENKHIYLNYNLTKSKTSGFIESVDYVLERKCTRLCLENGQELFIEDHLVKNIYFSELINQFRIELDDKDTERDIADIEINTHEKLLTYHIQGDMLYSDLNFAGYMGSSEDYIVHLLYALSETDMFNESPTKMDGRPLTEKEYYELLAKKMNKCVGKVN